MAVRELATSAVQAFEKQTWVELTLWLLLSAAVWVRFSARVSFAILRAFEGIHFSPPRLGEAFLSLG
jgi:hypothetical protein